MRDDRSEIARGIGEPVFVGDGEADTPRLGLHRLYVIVDARIVVRDDRHTSITAPLPFRDPPNVLRLWRRDVSKVVRSWRPTHRPP